MMDSSSCGNYSTTLVPHPNIILRGQCLTYMTEVCGSYRQSSMRYSVPEIKICNEKKFILFLDIAKNRNDVIKGIQDDSEIIFDKLGKIE